MKKFFLFAAAVVAAMTVNAAVLDLSKQGTAISDWTINEATLNSSESDATAGKYVYDIKSNVASESYVAAEPDYVFQIKNSSDKAKAFGVYPGKCYEFGGKNGVLIIKGLVANDVIKIRVASKGSTAANFKDEAALYPKNATTVTADADLVLPVKGADGADEDGYTWKVLEYKATGEGDVEIKEFKGGYRIDAIAINAEIPDRTQGIEDVKDAVKAEKRFENGQLVIIKNGVKFNALGAQL